MIVNTFEPISRTKIPNTSVVDLPQESEEDTISEITMTNAVKVSVGVIAANPRKGRGN